MQHQNYQKLKILDENKNFCSLWALSAREESLNSSATNSAIMNYSVDSRCIELQYRAIDREKSIVSELLADSG
jgi:hypothetical protein